MAFALTTTSSYSPAIYLFAAIFAGGLVPLLYKVAQNWRRGPSEDQKEIQASLTNDMGNLKDLLAEYRLEVEIHKRQLEDYREQLRTLTIELAKAQARIGFLEDQLADAKGEHRQLMGALDDAKRKRDQLQTDRDRLTGEAEVLHARIKALEDATGVTERLAGIHEDEPPD